MSRPEIDSKGQVSRGGVAVARVNSSIHLTESATRTSRETGAGGLGGGGDPNDRTLARQPP